MTRLSALKPRIATISTAKVEYGDSWRAGKDGSTARMYDYRWQQARLEFLAEHPLCVACLPRVTAASVVDHIAPHKGDKQLFWRRSNWQSLCATHHNEKTARGE